MPSTRSSGLVRLTGSVIAQKARSVLTPGEPTNVPRGDTRFVPPPPPAASPTEAMDGWGYADTRFEVQPDGSVTLTQNVPLEHLEDGPPGPDHDDALDLDGLVNATVTYTDFDGDSDNKSNPFGSLNDVHGHSYDSHLYEAFVDLKRSLVPCGWGLDRIRVGRQNMYAAFSYLVDGVRFDFERPKCWGEPRVSVFGGIPEYLYEDSRSGDWIAGFDVGLKPWRDGRMDSCSTCRTGQDTTVVTPSAVKSCELKPDGGRSSTSTTACP